MKSDHFPASFHFISLKELEIRIFRTKLGFSRENNEIRFNMDYNIQTDYEV